MITTWCADNEYFIIFEIGDVIIAVTDSTVTFAGGYVSPRISESHGYFNTWEEAHNWLCSQVGNKVSAMRKEYNELIRVYEKVLDFTKPKEEI